MKIDAEELEKTLFTERERLRDELRSPFTTQTMQFINGELHELGRVEEWLRILRAQETVREQMKKEIYEEMKRDREAFRKEGGKE